MVEILEDGYGCLEAAAFSGNSARLWGWFGAKGVMMTVCMGHDAIF